MEKILVTRTSMPSYEEYTEAIRPLWSSHWLTNMGVYHTELETKLKKYLKAQGLSLMVNGHMALELTIQAMDFPRGSEVITTPFTFISTTHAIVRNGLTPVFCDVKPEDGTMDESKIESLVTDHTVAIVPVHVYGNICNVEAIQKIADKYGLKVIYDAAHAFGVERQGHGIAEYGDASVFSFHATKVFNTIEGGAVAFGDGDLYDKLYNLKNFGIKGEELVVAVGANAKMNEFCAIMGLCNLKYIDDAITARRERAEFYDRMLSQIDGIEFFKFPADIRRNYSYYPVLIRNDRRDELYERLKEKEIYSRKYFYPLTSDQACFKNKYKQLELPVARKLARSVLVLPMYEELSLEQIERIYKVCRECLGTC